MAEAAEMVGTEPETGYLSPRLLEMCVITGVPSKTLRQVIQDQHVSVVLDVSPEVLSIHAPPFVGCQTRPRPTSHITWRHPEELTAFRAGEQAPDTEIFTERLSIPTNIDLCGLPELCFPDGIKLELEMKEEMFHFLVLTDIQGNRQQCVVVHIYREIQIRDAAQPQGHSGHESPKSLPNATHFFIPYGICLITKFPYYSVLQDSLSCFLLELRKCGESDFENRVREFAAQLCLVPCPPPGAFQLSYELGPLCIVLSPPQDPESLVIDIGLHTPFLCFKPDTILQILTCILIERRLVFVSSDWPLLTLVTECFLHFLYPLQWRHPYIPVLANQMLDLVMAPTVFLMGCHRRHLETINEVEDLILVDIDNGTVLTTQQRQLEIPGLPGTAVEKFLSSARELQVNSELASAHRAVSTSLAMSRQRERVRRTTLNTKIQQLFLHLQGNILGDVSKHLNHKHRMFLKKEFLDSREPTAQAFYCSLLKTDLFHCFLKARLNRKSDAFTRWELTARVKREQGSQRPPPVSPVEIPRKSGEQSTLGRYNQLPGEEPGSERNAHQLQRRVSKFSGRSPQDKEVPRTLALPSFPANPLDYASVATYYTKLIDGISAEIEKAGAEAETLAVCFYLRGIVCLAQGRSLQALLDFQKLEKINMNFFPWELVKQTLEAMAPEQMREVHKTEVLKHLIYEMVEKHWDRARQEESVRNYELPKAPLNKQEFGVQIQAAGIINNSDTTDRLFDVLTGGQQKLVDPQTFTEFYTRWTEMKYDADSITLSAEVTKNLQETERISKVSNPVKTSCGLGRVAMTQKRLFLLTEGQPFYKEIARFRNIEEVESCLPVSVFPLKILALRIKVRDKKEPFVANLKSERDLWKLVIREMVAGKFLADRHKDPQYVQQALSNVQLINVVARCNLQQRPINMASKLASLTHSLGEEPPTVPRMTSEALKHTLHFPDSNSSLCSVDVLLYVPGSLDPEQGADAHPRLWCALSDGRVVMYNAATWVMDQSPVQAGRSRLNCMVSVGHEQVWVGSEDSSIYIIDAARVMCNRRLAGHRNQVSGMALEDVTDLGRATRQVYSCSLDGMVVLWDPEVQEVKSQFQLPQCWSLTSIAIHHNYLWCCVEYSLLVLSRDGLQLREVKFSPNPSSSSVLMTYFLIIPQRDELWTVSCQQSNLYIWKTDNPSNPIKTIPLPDCAIVVCMIQVKRQVWVGGGVTHDKTKGRIYVIDMDTYSLHKELEASCGLIRAMCSAEDRYILSGTQDSKAIIWKVD